jgi:CheY-like chemotaxis protein
MLPGSFWCTVASLKSVLVVDDDELLGRMISELLRGEGYQVWTAHDGIQGYSTYRQSQTDVVVTDIEMPRLDGFGMMNCIRTLNSSVKTVYMSGAAAQYRRALIMESQAFGAPVIRKPFIMMDLLEVLLSVGEKLPPVSPETSSCDELVWKEAGNPNQSSTISCT